MDLKNVTLLITVSTIYYNIKICSTNSILLFILNSSPEIMLLSFMSIITYFFISSWHPYYTTPMKNWFKLNWNSEVESSELLENFGGIIHWYYMCNDIYNRFKSPTPLFNHLSITGSNHQHRFFDHLYITGSNHQHRFF